MVDSEGGATASVTALLPTTAQGPAIAIELRTAERWTENNGATTTNEAADRAATAEIVGRGIEVVDGNERAEIGQGQDREVDRREAVLVGETVNLPIGDTNEAVVAAVVTAVRVAAVAAHPIQSVTTMPLQRRPGKTKRSIMSRARSMLKKPELQMPLPIITISLARAGKGVKAVVAEERRKRVKGVLHEVAADRRVLVGHS